MILEICANGLQSALNAQAGGADRIELCVSLETGGLTPSLGLIKEVSSQLNIPVHVLIRPRGGNFIYAVSEKSIILEDINQCRELNVAGVVIGALNNDNNPDVAFLEKCISMSGEMDLTFHRAFDVMNRIEKNIQILVELGFKRILTSGGKATAFEGKHEIAKLVEHFGDRIEIMAGSGINLNNAKELVNSTKITAVHSSARSINIQKTGPLFEEEITSNIQLVRKLKALLNSI